MRVKLREATTMFRGWQGRLPGTTLDVTDGEATTLIRRGIATEVRKPTPNGRKRANNKRKS